MRIIHMFMWNLKDITKEVEYIKGQGFEAIQIPVLQPNKFGSDIPWWGQYQPIDFKIGNQFGTKQDLIDLCEKANKNGLKVIVDVVCNHVASVDSGEVIPHQFVSEKLQNNSNFWKVSDRIFNWNDRNEVITKSLGLPSLKLANLELQDIIIAFLNEMIDCGVRGFRFDAGKNISMPHEDGNTFWTRVLGSLNKKDELFNYTEVIYCDKNIIDGYCRYINVLTDSFGSDKNKLVTFIDSHDLEHEFHVTSKYTNNDIIREYNVLCQNYPNTLFYVRSFNDCWKSREILDIHKRYSSTH